jgi:peptide/nickel transport system permease protein
MGAVHRSVRAYLLTRIALALPMLLILLTFVFVLMRVAPGDPINSALGGRLSAADLAVRRHEIGLDRPIVVQYFDYLTAVARLNFGTTLTDDRSVTSIVVQNGSATLELATFALFVAVIVGFPLGLVAGRFRDTPFDFGSRLFGIVVYATPVFFLGYLGQLVFGQLLGWLPTSGRASPIVEYEIPTRTHLYVLDSILATNWSALVDVLRHLILPGTALGLLTAGVFLRIVRVNVLQALRSDYIEAARARGISERAVLIRHAFKNALLPVISVTGIQVAWLLSGAVLTEETFNWPGIGYTLLNYINNRDYIAVQGIITFLGVVVVVVSILIDIVTAWIDPKVRF